MRDAAYQAVQRLRKFFGLRHHVVDRPRSGGSSPAIVEHSIDGSQSVVFFDRQFVESLKANNTLLDTLKYRQATPGVNRKFFTYATLNPTASPEYVAKYMTRGFNAWCSDIGVQCTVTMDSTTFKQMFQFKNRSDKVIKIEYDAAAYYVQPHGEMDVLTRSGEIPTLTPMEEMNEQEKHSDEREGGR